MLQKKNSFTFNHADQQDDLYVSMTTAEIKTAFDSRGEELKKHTNDLIDALKATTPGDSGADNIGASAIAGVTGTTVQAQTKNLKQQIDSLVTKTNEMQAYEETLFDGIQDRENEINQANTRIDTANQNISALQTGKTDKSLFDTEITSLKTSTTNLQNNKAEKSEVQIVQNQLNQTVIQGDSSVEAAQARVKADGTSFTTLRDRLNSTDAQLAERPTQDEVRLKTVKLELEDMSETTLGAMSGNATFNLLSVPQDDSVTLNKLSGELRNKNIFLANLINNGDFSNGTTGWTQRSPSTLSVTNGIGLVSAPSTTATAGVQQDIAISSESKVYFKVKVKSVKTAPFYIHASSAVIVGNPVINEWTDFSTVQTVTTPTVRFYQALNTGESFEIDEIIAINLTKEYGVGNEPTTAEMDELLSSLGWFDGNFILSQKQLYTMINQNTGLGDVLTVDGEAWEVI